MNEAVKQAFKDACAAYLDTLNLMRLRPYGREIGVKEPTKKQKEELIADIVSVLAGEKMPVERATRGAPVKDDFVDPQIVAAIQRLQLIYEPAQTLEDSEERKQHLNKSFQERLQEMPKFKGFGVAEEPAEQDKLYTGQLKTYDGVACLLPLFFDLSKNKIIVSIEQIRRYDLRDGDIVSCKVYLKNSVIYASEIVEINGRNAETLSRVKFDEASVGLPTEKISFFQANCLEGKFLDWLMPIGKGQRSLVVGAPKTGKTHFALSALKSLVKNEQNLEVLVLLIDQAPEVLYEYQKTIDKTRLIATTYMDEASKHVLAAEFLLARAKRLAECGKDVVLIVDGINALAKAYDETDDTEGKVLPCGLGVKTMHYVKKFFAAAKRLDKKGSLTIMATVSEKTGNPADDALVTELSSIANHEIVLDATLAKKHMYPAFDYDRCHADYAAMLFDDTLQKGEFVYRNKVKPHTAPDFLLGALAGARSYPEFFLFMEKVMKKIDG